MSRDSALGVEPGRDRLLETQHMIQFVALVARMEQATVEKRLLMRLKRSHI